MENLSAARYNPAIRAVYDHMRSAGKSMKVAATPPHVSCSIAPGRSAPIGLGNSITNLLTTRQK
jgi:hypothetical protein